MINFRRCKVTRGVVGAPSKSGLFLGPAPAIMTEAVQPWSGSVHSTTRQVGVVWVLRGNKLIRCHPIPLRRCSEGEVSIASLNSHVQISMPTNVTELTKALSPGQHEDLSASLPTGDDLRFGEVDLGEPRVGQETMAPSFVPSLPFGTVVDPLQNTSTRLSSSRILFLHLLRRESDVQVDESSVAPGSMQIAPRDLTRSKGELVRSSLENAYPAIVRRRIVGIRNVIPT